MTTLKDPAATILTSMKPILTEKDKQDNEKVKADAKTERLKAWGRPKTKKERDDGRAERKADWEAQR